MNVHCQIWEEDNRLKVYRQHTLIGVVTNTGGDPVLTLQLGVEKLSFGDMEIIMDNWNQMQEMRSAKIPVGIQCPHCQYCGQPEMGPDNKSAICNWCHTPFNIENPHECR